MKGVVAFVGLFCTLTVCAVAIPLSDLLDEQTLFELRKGLPLSKVQFSTVKPLLAPQSRFLLDQITAIQTQLKPNTMAESLYLYNKPSTAQKGGWSEQERTKLYNQCTAISSLTGIQYFSVSRNAMRVFYEKSTVIDDPDKKRVLSDPVYSTPPAQMLLYARQEDLTFGSNIYRYDYLAQKDAFLFIQQNMTSLDIWFVTAVGKTKLRSILSVFDAGASLLVYVVSMADAFSLFGFEERIGSSFSNRAEAILSWFSTQADKAFAQ
ncbi:hypothetical protein FACS1894200_08650 [Spirochaetia bacterium]|nr:hypothetical protein FACS1894200_08650 [Spirochaetia bacterium]